MRNRYLRLVVSLVAALAISFFLITSSGEKQTVYRSVVVVVREVERNTPLTTENLVVKNISAEGVPEEALAAIPVGKVAGQKLWPGEFLFLPMVKDNPVSLPVPENRIFSLPTSLKAAGGVQPGDRVDVFLFYGDKTGQDGGESLLLLFGVTVVEILNQNGQVMAGKGDKIAGPAALPAVAKVLVTAEQANLLNAAANTGTIALARHLPESQPVKVIPPVLARGGSVQ